MACVMGSVMSKADGREADGENNACAQKQAHNTCLNALRN